MTPDGDVPYNLRGHTSLMVLCSLIICLLGATIQRRFLSPLRHVPGPWLASVTGLWRTRKYFRGQWHTEIVELHQKYGPVVRIAPDEVSFVDETALKMLYGHGQPNVKTDWYNTWSFSKENTVFEETDPKAHRYLRSRVSAAYTMSSVLRMEPHIHDVQTTSLQRLERFAQNNTNVKLDEWVNFFAFDVIGTLGIGRPFGFTEEGRDTLNLIQPLRAAIFISANTGHLPGQNIWINSPFHRLLSSIFPKIDPLGPLVDFCMGQIVGRRTGKNQADRYDMLSYFVATKNHKGEPASDTEVMAEVAPLLGAGADTTAGTILSTLGELMKRPQLYKEVQAEVDAAHKALALGDLDELKYLQALKLPLLHATIQEAMRYRPSIPYQLPRHTPPGGMEVHGLYIPQGTTVGISPAAINRSEEIYGADAGKFNPRRWLPLGDSKVEQDRVRTMESRLFTFGMGSRGCIGKNIALVEVYCYVAAFLRRFDAEVVRPWHVHSQFMSSPEDFEARLKVRTDAAS